ncbi:MAG: YncE family protein [Candidatus Babeliales bacterium]
MKQYFFASIVLFGSFFHSCAFVNSDRVVATVPVGITPAGLALTPDDAFAYVANNNNYTYTGMDTVSVIDLSNNTVIKTIHDASFNEPYTVTINKDGTKAYITNSNSTTITIIDIKTNSVSGIIYGFDGPSGLVITPDQKRGYVNNYGGPEGVGSGNAVTLNIVDLVSLAITGTIHVDLAPAALAISSDGARVYSANYVDGNPGTGTVNVIDTASNTLTATIFGFSGPFDIVLTPDDKYAYVTNFGSNNFIPVGTTVSVADLKKNVIIQTIDVGLQPAGIALTPNGRFAVVTNYNTLYADYENFTDLTPGEGTINIIDTKTNTVTPVTVVVGQSPANIAIASNAKYAYISNYTANTVSVVNILERAWL